MSLFRSTVIRYFLIFAVCMLPLQPLVLLAKKRSISQEELIAHVRKYTKGPSSRALGKLAVGIIPDFEVKNSIITATEREELQIDALAKKLDKTETTFGSVALAQSLQPVNNLELILQRQSWAKALLEDPQLYADVRRDLKQIKQSEHAILAYWDRTQQENGSKLFARAESFYYNWLQILTGKKLNNSKLALEAAMAFKMAKIAWDVLYYFGGQKLGYDFLRWQFNGKDFDPLDSIKEGLLAPFTFLWPLRTNLSTKIKRNQADVMDVFAGAASFGDTMYFAQRGTNSESHVDLGKLGQEVWWQQYKIGKAYKHVTSYIPQIVTDYTPSFIGVPTFIKQKVGYFKPDGRWVQRTTAIDPDQLPWVRWVFNTSWGFAIAAASTWFKGAFFWEGFNRTCNSTVSTIKTMKELHIHTIHLADAMNTIKGLAQRLEKHPVLGTSTMVVRIQKSIITASDTLKQLFKLLENDTFSITKEKTHIFSRGNVFLAHRLMMKVHKEIIPILQAIGELDALYAMVTNIKESSKTNVPWSFVEFISDAKAKISVEDGWLPLVHNAVPNSISFGDNSPNKIIISGPNGGGKSVFLKFLGALVVFAESLGIVPAKRVSMTFFDKLFSCIHPEESLEHELSTFMAEKMRVDVIKEAVFSQQHNPHFKTLVLLDEPFRGTVDAEQADRTYVFGREIAPLQQALVVMAAHVEKPTRLEADTDGLFANYYVRINELPDGQFVREFKLERGIPTWWFTNAQRRSQFIDFITHEKHKEQIAKIRAAQENAAAAA